MTPGEFLQVVAPRIPLSGGEDHHTEAAFFFEGRHVHVVLVGGWVYGTAGGIDGTQFMLRLDDPRIIDRFKIEVGRAVH